MLTAVTFKALRAPGNSQGARNNGAGARVREVRIGVGWEGVRGSLAEVAGRV